MAAVKEEGFAGASSRSIAARAGVNQALVFYHFGSLDSLLLAALDRTSEERMARYRAAVADTASLEDLIRVARDIYREDRDTGHITVVSQLVAGSVARPELASEVLARMETWIAFAEEGLERALAPTPLGAALPIPELARAVVTFYLGANLLTQLGGADVSIEPLFDRALELVPLLR